MSPIGDILYLSPIGVFYIMSLIGDIGIDMRVRTPKDIGLIIRDQRRKLKLGQQQLADKVGVGRQWIVEVEKGKPRAGIELLLRTLEKLGLNLTVNIAASSAAKSANQSAGVGGYGGSHDIDIDIDIDAIVDKARGKGR